MSEMIARPADQVSPSAAVQLGVARCRIDPPAGIYARNWGPRNTTSPRVSTGPFWRRVLVIRGEGSPDPLVLAWLGPRLVAAGRG